MRSIHLFLFPSRFEFLVGNAPINAFECFFNGLIESRIGQRFKRDVFELHLKNSFF